MDEQKISKGARSVRLTLSDGRAVEGQVFLNLFEARTGLPERVGTLINGEETFLPVKSAEGVFLVNLRQVVSVRVDVDEERDDLMLLGQKHTVCIGMTNAPDSIADIYVDLPETSSRPKDYFNQSLRFFRLFQRDEVIYINPAYILYIRD